MTGRRELWESNGSISTHILTKRMTKVSIKSFKKSVISTHILTKRMTDSRWICAGIITFQLTSSRRGWQIRADTTISISYFNSHPHEEDDTLWPSYRLSWLYFNSHPHEEDDRSGGIVAFITSISTHILTKRMTEIRYRKENYMNISTHILTKRMTKSGSIMFSKKDISTHILTKRMTVL